MLDVIAGLMVGRTPEYLCKKTEQKEVKMAIVEHYLMQGGKLFSLLLNPGVVWG